MARVREVFVAGGMPTITYRSRVDLEDQVRQHLNFETSVLSISGPIKTGKTVLIRHVVPEAITIEGGQVRSFADFLGAVLDHFGVPTAHEQQVEEEASDVRERTGKVGSTQVAAAEYHLTDQTTSRTGHKQTIQRSPTTAAKEALAGGAQPLVIDDFHYIDPEAQVAIVRFLKSLVFDGLPVIFISVPHRAYDAVRVEREMTGRVKVLNVGFWQDDELLDIPAGGFDELNVADTDSSIARKLVGETFSSPHLMQQFCFGICQQNQVLETSATSVTLQEPPAGWRWRARRHRPRAASVGRSTSTESSWKRSRPPGRSLELLTRS